MNFYQGVQAAVAGIGVVMEEFQKNIREAVFFFQERFPKEYVKIHQKLNRRSWYIINDLTLNELIELQECDELEIDNVMSDYARRIVNETEFRLLEHFPHRSNVINQVFFAHRNECFALSVPTMLTLADGIGHELFNVSIYSVERGTGEPKTKKMVKNLEENEMSRSMYLYPLDALTSFAEGTNNLEKIRLQDVDFAPLNRHQVVHGLVSEYDTELNSLRCVVLLSYLLDIKEEYFNDAR
ncbi:hypothetical protein LJR153_002003 [Paenibacillus sp. LjRoot153]|uniref:hypothetical protein n=1 Tax=Paenibacillus sp. LjRoot153 TaxID=3342270 RepID=UPI003ECEA386